MKKLLLIALCAAATPAFAQVQIDASHPRTISISGEANEEFAPDQVVLSLSLVSQDPNLGVAKEHNDGLVGRLITIAHNLNIPKESLATSSVYIAPEYSYDNGKQHFTGYNVNRSIRITLNDMNTHEKLLSAIVDAKIDQVNGIEFKLAHPEEHAAALRIKAFNDAKAKADALAQAAGGKLGSALAISTEGSGSVMPPRPMPMRAMAANESASVAPTLPGMVDLREAVTVTFGLE